MNPSGSVLHELSPGLGRIGQPKGVPDLSTNKLCVLEDIMVASHSLRTNILDVEDAVDAPVDGSTTVQRARVDAVLQPSGTVPKSLPRVSHFTPVADGSTQGPTAVHALELRKPTRLNSVPLIDAGTDPAGPLPAAQTSTNLIEHTHPSPCK